MVDSKGLEESIASSGSEDNSNAKEQDQNRSSNNQQMSKDEIIGYHKGAINTLIAERNELLKIVGVTESLINAHANELSKLGVHLKP